MENLPNGFMHPIAAQCDKCFEICDPQEPWFMDWESTDKWLIKCVCWWVYQEFSYY